ncbi:MAG: DUF4214 domain-containing protein [Pirellulales bacterium]
MDGAEVDRLFHVWQGASLTLAGMTLTGGRPPNATGTDGGAIFFEGEELTLRGVMATKNEARRGGAIFAAGGNVVVEASTLFGNVAYEAGGAIFAGGALHLTNSTLDGNLVQLLAGSEFNGGGGIASSGTIRLDHATVTNNEAPAGGGIWAEGTLARGIVAGNRDTGGAPDLRGLFTSEGFNLVGFAEASSGLVDGEGGDVVGSLSSPIDPGLGPLRDNGGDVWTRLPGDLSPALDAVPPTFPTYDSRGILRPQGAAADIGAAEAHSGSSKSLDDDYLFSPDASVVSTLGVLADDENVAAFTTELVLGPRYGTLRLEADGSFTYRAGADFFGLDRFSYRGRLTPEIESEAATARLLTPQALAVQRLYEKVLFRDPDWGGWEYWTGRVYQGTASMGTIASGIFESDERLNPIIREMYEEFLFREADADGLAYWREQVWKRDGSPQRVISGIVSSPEFFQAAGGSNRLWVTELYREGLGREPDPGGLDFWTSALDSGALDREAVVLGFVRSIENFRNQVQDWYEQYLGRPADPAAETYHVNRLQQGVSDRQIQIELVDSLEFLQSQQQPLPGFALRLPSVQASRVEFVPVSDDPIQISLPGGGEVVFAPGSLADDAMVTVERVSHWSEASSGALEMKGPTISVRIEPGTFDPDEDGSDILEAAAVNATSALAPGSMQVHIPFGAYAHEGGVPVAAFVDRQGNQQVVGLLGDPAQRGMVAEVPVEIIDEAQAFVVGIARLRGAVASQPGTFLWTPSGWSADLSELDTACERTLVIVHGMLSSAPAAFPAHVIDHLMNSGGYGQVIRFNYNWTQSILRSSAELARLLTWLRARGLPEVDIMAHSEGVPVTLGAIPQSMAIPQTRLKIENVMMFGGPIMGTPIASEFVAVQLVGILASPLLAATPLLVVPVPWNQNPVSLRDVLFGGFARDLGPESETLQSINAVVAARMNQPGNLEETRLLAAGGTRPLPVVEFLQGVFKGEPNDGMIPLSSALGEGSGLNFSGLSQFELDHVQLNKDPNAVGTVLAQRVHTEEDPNLLGIWEGTWERVSHEPIAGFTVSGNWKLTLTEANLQQGYFTGSLEWSGNDVVWDRVFDEDGNLIDSTPRSIAVDVTLRLDKTNTVLERGDLSETWGPTYGQECFFYLYNLGHLDPTLEYDLHFFLVLDLEDEMVAPDAGSLYHFYSQGRLLGNRRAVET